MRMRLRPATVDDSREIAEIHVAGWRTAYRDLMPEAFLANLSVEKREAGWRSAIERGEPTILVAIDGQGIVGWIAFGKCRDEDQPAATGEVWAVYARPDHLSKGVGRTLWLAAHAALIASGIRRITLWALAANERACRFYRMAGFVQDSVPPKRAAFGGVSLEEIRFVYDETMKKSDVGRGESASELISKRIAELGDWRGETLARMRKLIKEADPDVVEEWKWMGTPVWSHDGNICTGETYKSVVKLTFAKGASLRDAARLFNASLDGNVRRAIDIHEGEKVDQRAFKALIKEAVALNSSAAKAKRAKM